MHWQRKAGLWATAFGVLIWACPALVFGTPYFVLETEADWLNAQSAGKITPVADGEWWDYQAQWSAFREEGPPYPSHSYRMPDLYVYPGGGSGGTDPEDAGLVMAWGDPAMPDGPYSAAWQFDYQLDPNLANCTISITVTPPSPSGINVVSFGMKDNLGNIRAWYWSCGPGGVLPYDVPTTITINTSLWGTGAAVPAATAYMSNPAFDISRVQWFIVDENANWVGMMGIPPPGQLVPLPWNYWHNLVVVPYQGRIKWAQPPTYNDFSPYPQCIWGWDEVSMRDFGPIAADDFLCKDDRPITDIHWWGSYLNWDGEGPPSDAPDMFHIAIWTDVPAMPPDFSHPGTVLHEWWVPRAQLLERKVGCDFHPDFMAVPDACFKYDFLIPQAEWFWQEPGPTVYWISIAAVYPPTLPVHPWGWKTREHFYNDDAVRIFDPVSPSVGSTYVAGAEIIDLSGISWDLAFVLTTDRPALSEIKWDQPPEPAQPDNVYLGWNDYSVWDDLTGLGQVDADDWYCDTNDPVTKVRWWGSFIGWTGVDPPQLPDAFYLHVWTDVPAGVDKPWSHPGSVIHEIFCTNYTWTWVGWDYNPATGTYESCFLFEQELLPHEYFYQEAGGNIYWLSIAAWYSNVTPTYPWGWKTRPRDSTSPAPDDAVRIFDPSAPTVGAAFVNGEPIFWPTETDSWDLAFELIATPQVEIKWVQPPDPSLSGLHSHDYDVGGVYDYVLNADDFECQGGDITRLRWWGNFELDFLGQEKRGNGIQAFHLSLHVDDPAGPALFPVPGEPPIWQMDVPMAMITVVNTGVVNVEGSPIYEYTFVLPTPITQTPFQWYWLDVMALAVDPLNPPIWRWQEANRSPFFLGHAPAAQRTMTSSWQSIVWPTPVPERYSDFAFEINSGTAGSPYVKWSQPPEPYMPDDGFYGWDELSMYGGPQIVADDWLCTNGYPVTDLHWWGSFLGWGYLEPPQLPDAFHIGIWTDVPADTSGVGDPFSHPGQMIWQNFCDNFSWEFVGWDWNPIDPTQPPEATYLFHQFLSEDEWFHQETGENIYWVSISAMYFAGQPPYAWGWKTRPRDPNSTAPDDAVVIWDPLAPAPGVMYVAGANLWWPTPADSWDMAFRLTTLPTCKPADANCDGNTDAGDLILVRTPGNWANTAGTAIDPRCDVNRTGNCDAGDLIMIRTPGTWATSTGPCNCPPYPQ